MTLAKGHLSVVYHISNNFYSETTGPISIKLHMQPSGIGGKKVYTFDQGHMAKMASMPIYDKNF